MVRFRSAPNSKPDLAAIVCTTIRSVRSGQREVLPGRPTRGARQPVASGERRTISRWRPRRCGCRSRCSRQARQSGLSGCRVWTREGEVVAVVVRGATTMRRGRSAKPNSLKSLLICWHAGRDCSCRFAARRVVRCAPSERTPAPQVPSLNGPPRNSTSFAIPSGSTPEEVGVRARNGHIGRLDLRPSSLRVAASDSARLKPRTCRGNLPAGSGSSQRVDVSSCGRQAVESLDADAAVSPGGNSRGQTLRCSVIDESGVVEESNDRWAVPR